MLKTKQAIEYHQFGTFLDELCYVAKEIQRQLENGGKPQDIAVIARKHSTLREATKIFNYYQIPIYYERGQNVLEEEMVKELVTIVRFINSLNKGRELEADELLTEILAYPFWGIDRLDIWKLSINSYKNREPPDSLWLEIMMKANQENYNFSNPSKLRQIADFLLFLAQTDKYEPVERVLDLIIGSDLEQISEETEDDGEFPEDTNLRGASFISSFRQFYFGKRIFSDDKKILINQEYLNLLSSLRTFINAVRKYRSKDVLKVKDLVEFVDLLEINNLPLIDNSSLNSPENSVNLLTAHKSKGLEFNQVFLLSCHQDEWFPKNRGDKLSLPSNLPLNASPDDNDDKLRLFYVAVTRAKNTLHLSTHKFKSAESSKKELVPLYFLDDLEKSNGEPLKCKKDGSNNKDNALETWYNAFTKPRSYSRLETTFLDTLLSDYKLSVTHLINFLDIVNGGPFKFFEDNLLRFPKSKNPQSSYGSAMHNSLNLYLQEYLLNNRLPPLGRLHYFFETSLYHQRLSSKDYSEYLQKGLENLDFYYQNSKDIIHENMKLEYDFSGEGVNLEGAKITGKIDKLEFLKGNQIIVTDYKTGKPLYSTNQTSASGKIKLWKYETQLLFYKLLIEHSNSFGRSYKVEEGRLEFLDSKSHNILSSDSELIIYRKQLQKPDADILSSLIQIVYQKIIKLDFPEIGHYEKNFKGINKFIEDLLNNKV
jgi:DNA helicase II / ATP-dependent DNA helicase PcrA